MTKLFTKKRRLVVTGAALALAIGAGSVAYAYFTTTGSGSASATGGSNTTLTITQTNTITGLTPGGPSLPVTYTISNPAANGDQSLGLVSATIASVTPVGANTCAASNFAVTAAGSAVGGAVLRRGARRRITWTASRRECRASATIVGRN